MKSFITYLVRWISNNLSIPFWMVGHIHLSLNLYKDLYEIIASVGMNVIVGIGFWLDWKEHKKQTYVKRNRKTNRRNR
jgi:hypothetical protein